jgi:hypothetical protein
MVIRTGESMGEPDGVDGRHKAGHDGEGSLSTVIAIRAKRGRSRDRWFRLTRKWRLGALEAGSGRLKNEKPGRRNDRRLGNGAAIP